MTEPTNLGQLASLLAETLLAVHRYRQDDEDDVRADDIAEAVTYALDAVSGGGVEDVDYLLDPLEYVCLCVAGVWGWEQTADDLVEEIAEHLNGHEQ